MQSFDLLAAFSRNKEEWSRHILKFKDMIGVYALYLGESCVYVGKSDCMHIRLRAHLYKTGMIFDGIKVYEHTAEIEAMPYRDGKNALSFYEACLIEILKPTGNQIRPSVKAAYNRLPVELRRKYAVNDIEFYKP